MPGFRPPDSAWQIIICRQFNIPFNSSLENNASIGRENLRKFVPNKIVPYLGDGNCYFSTVSYLLTGSTLYHAKLKTILVDNMLNKLRNSCNEFLKTKFVYQSSNYRNIQDWVNKRGMSRPGTWATDLEIFATALLFKIDIWVFLGQEGTRWTGFSGNGYSLAKFLKEPTSNAMYIQNLGCHYEPVLSDKPKTNTK